MRRKILFAMILLALLPASLVGFITHVSMEKSAAAFQEKALVDIAKIITEHVTHFYIAQYTAVRDAAAQEPYEMLLEMAKEDIDYQNYKFCVEEARTLINEGIIGEGALIDSSGKVILATNRKEEGLMLNKTGLYESIMKGANSYKGTVIGDDGSQKVELAVPIKVQNNKIIGILKHKINLEDLAEYIRSVEIGDTGYVYMLGRNGTIFYHGVQRNIGTLHSEFKSMSQLDKLISDYKNDELEEKNGIIKYKYDGIDMVGAFVKSDDMNEIVIAAMEQEEAFGVVDKTRDITFVLCVLIGLAAAAVGCMISRKVIDPLSYVNMKITEIAGGDLTARCCYHGSDEYKQLCDNVNRMAENLQKSEMELRLSTRIDSLTHIPNRYAIYEVLDTLLYKHKNQALLMLDLDGFKLINDNLGHDMGDKTLMEVGEILRSLPQHICYPSRLSGDEFLIFVTNWEEERYPEKIAETIIQEIKDIRFIEDLRINIGASIGIEYLTEEKMDKKKLIKHSDMAMYKAKDTGKNTYVVYSQLNGNET